VKFLVEGEMTIGARERRPFVKEVDAQNERAARERAVTLLGSAHRIKRASIRLGAVRKVGEG